VYEMLPYDDQLAAVFARLLLWTDAAKLPIEQTAGWDCYLRTWRPGKPHQKTWPPFWQQASSAARIAA
jgi:hypothetical protein